MRGGLVGLAEEFCRAHDGVPVVELDLVRYWAAEFEEHGFSFMSLRLVEQMRLVRRLASEGDGRSLGEWLEDQAAGQAAESARG